MEELKIKNKIAREIAGRQLSKEDINDATDAIYKILKEELELNAGTVTDETINSVYSLKHSGYFLGGVIIVVDTNIDSATKTIIDALVLNNIDPEDYDLSEIELVDLSKPNIVYLDTGDY